MIRIAFTLIGGANWTGGHNYLLNLLKALIRHQSGRLTPVLFVGNDCTDSDAQFQEIKGLEIVRSLYLNVQYRKKALFNAMLLGQDRGLKRIYQEQAIDLIFENAQFFGWRFGIPAIAWIPDFQHRMLPELFPRGLWWKREIGFRMQVAAKRTIMLSSEDARYACERYYPSTKGRTCTVHFAVPPGPEISYPKARKIADLYGLPECFFFMPNQFFRHKNHGLVLEALTILRDRGHKVVIAASGKQADFRDPDYFPKFIKTIETRALQDEFRLLGLIPYDHVSSLMRASAAMVNPSLFEGWSTTVEEARAMGTPMLLSDLDVHHEQMGSQAIYFDRNSPQSLADALNGFAELSQTQRQHQVNEARQKADECVKQFSEDFAALAQASVQRAKNL